MKGGIRPTPRMVKGGKVGASALKPLKMPKVGMRGSKIKKPKYGYD